MKAEGLAAEAAMRLADTLMAGQLAYPKRTLLQPHGVERKAAGVERKAAGAERKVAGGRIFFQERIFFQTALLKHMRSELWE